MWSFYEGGRNGAKIGDFDVVNLGWRWRGLVGGFGSSGVAGDRGL